MDPKARNEAQTPKNWAGATKALKMTPKPQKWAQSTKFSPKPKKCVQAEKSPESELSLIVFSQAHNGTLRDYEPNLWLIFYGQPNFWGLHDDVWIFEALSQFGYV